MNKEEFIEFINKKEFILVGSLDNSPLYLDFKDNPYHDSDLIICDIPLEVVLQFLNQQQNQYFTQHIRLSRLVKEYLIAYKEYKEEEKQIWKTVEEVENFVENMTKNEE